jgi:hypothetical protein
LAPEGSVPAALAPNGSVSLKPVSGRVGVGPDDAGSCTPVADGNRLPMLLRFPTLETAPPGWTPPPGVTDVVVDPPGGMVVDGTGSVTTEPSDSPYR